MFKKIYFISRKSRSTPAQQSHDHVSTVRRHQRRIQDPSFEKKLKMSTRKILRSKKLSEGFGKSLILIYFYFQVFYWRHNQKWYEKIENYHHYEKEVVGLLWSIDCRTKCSLCKKQGKLNSHWLKKVRFGLYEERINSSDSWIDSRQNSCEAAEYVRAETV